MSDQDKDVHKVRMRLDGVPNPSSIRPVWRYDKELGAYFHEKCGYAYDNSKDLLSKLNEYAAWEARAKHLQDVLHHIANCAQTMKHYHGEITLETALDLARDLKYGPLPKPDDPTPSVEEAEKIITEARSLCGFNWITGLQALVCLREALVKTGSPSPQPAPM